MSYDFLDLGVQKGFNHRNYIIVKVELKTYNVFVFDIHERSS